jgi:hypothetical protein
MLPEVLGVIVTVGLEFVVIVIVIWFDVAVVAVGH